MTDKEIVRMVARSDGFHFPPAYYRHEVKKRFDREVTSATVTKAIGAYRTRLSLPEKALIRKANDLLAACHFDKALATAMVGKAAARFTRWALNVPTRKRLKRIKLDDGVDKFSHWFIVEVAHYVFSFRRETKNLPCEG